VSNTKSIEVTRTN